MAQPGIDGTSAQKPPSSALCTMARIFLNYGGGGGNRTIKGCWKYVTYGFGERSKGLKSHLCPIHCTRIVQNAPREAYLVLKAIGSKRKPKHWTRRPRNSRLGFVSRHRPGNSDCRVCRWFQWRIGGSEPKLTTRFNDTEPLPKNIDTIRRKKSRYTDI